MQNYDGWKLSSGGDLLSERLGDACADAESALLSRLRQTIEEANAPSSSTWSLDEVVADADDAGEIFVEVSLKLGGIPTDAHCGELQEIAAAFCDLGKRLEMLAQHEKSSLSSPGLKMAPSARTRGAQRREAGLG